LSSVFTLLRERGRGGGLALEILGLGLGILAPPASVAPLKAGGDNQQEARNGKSHRLTLSFNQASSAPASYRQYIDPLV
jgi:hypothetical protein